MTLETELGGHGLSNLCPIEPDPQLEGRTAVRDHGLSGMVLFYVSLFKRLIDYNSESARPEYLAWRVDEDSVFGRLRVWVCGYKEIVSAEDAGKILCNLSDDVFWGSRHQRDLLLVLAKRWSDFPSEVKLQLESRLVAGPSRWEEEEDSTYIERRAYLSLNRIYWMKSKDCRFHFNVDQEILKLREIVPKWQPQHGDGAAASMEVHSGWVRTSTDHAELLDVPLQDVLNRAALLMGRRPDDNFIERNPFAGLAASRPVKALSALTVSAKGGSYRAWAWRTFFNSEARKSDKPRFSALVAERVSKLPTNVVSEIIHPVSEWLLTSSSTLLRKYPQQFDSIWSKLIAVIVSDSNKAKTSIIRGNKEPDWAMEALNAPVGKLMRALMNDPQKDGLREGEGFPLPWIKRVQDLLSLEDNLRRHALVMIAYNLNWFFAIDPIWTENTLLKLLEESGEDQNAVWAGFFWGAKAPGQKFYRRLKPHLLKRGKEKTGARRDYGEVLAGILLAGWGSEDSETGCRCVADDELRDVLVKADDEFRCQVLWQLERWSSEKDEGNERWARKLPEFFERVWPRQKSAKTPRVTARLCALATSDAATFAERVEIILPFVTEIDQDVMHEVMELEGEIVGHYPEKTLALLSAILPEDAARWPYGIKDLLDQIESSEPSLTNDPRMYKLKRRWNAR